MKKIIFAIPLCICLSIAQTYNPIINLPLKPPPPKSTILNGTSQYWSATPSYVSKNTLINYNPALLNGGFETAGAGGTDVFADWSESARIADTSDAHSGSHACKFQFNSTGAAVTIQTNSILATKRAYRVFVWLKASKSGMQIKVYPSSHGNPNSITPTTEWALYQIPSSQMVFTNQTSLGIGSYTTISANANGYILVDDVLLEEVEGSLDLSGNERIVDYADIGLDSKPFNWTTGGTHSIDTSSTDKRTGTRSGRLVATGIGDTTTNHIKLAPSNFSTLELGKKYCVELWARASKAGTNLIINIGKKSQTTSSISAVSGTFTKAVLNFQATATEIASNDSLRIYVNQADTVYIDDVSMTQKKDMILLTKLSTSKTSLSSERVVDYRGANNEGHTLYGSSSGATIRISTADEQGNSATASGTRQINDSRIHNFASTFNSSGSTQIYSDGVTDGSPSSNILLGKIYSRIGLRIGAAVSTPANFWSGKIGETQIILFDALPADGGASIIYDAYQRFKRGLPYANSYTGGTVVGWWDWQTGGLDRSGYKNHLTPTANPPIVGGR